MKKYIIYCLFLSLCTTACSDWLDVKPNTQVEVKDMFSTYDGFKDALTGCYIKMKDRTLYGENLSMSYIETAAHLWDLDLSVVTYQTDYQAFGRAEWENEKVKSVVEAIYKGLFNVIVQANSIIQHLEPNREIFEDTIAYRIIEGEAYALRAFCHFDILRLFGQMPVNPIKKISLPYSNEVSVKELPPYYDYEAFVINLEQDLLKAGKALEDIDPVLDRAQGMDYAGHEDNLMNYRRQYLNYYAVKALQARFYLYTHQPLKAYNAAKVVYDKLPVILSGREDLADGYNACPSECLFVLSNNEMIDYSISVLGMGNTSLDWSLFISNEMLEDLFHAFPTSNRSLRLWERSMKLNTGVICPVLKKYYYDVSASHSDDELLLKLQLIPMIRMSEIYLILMETTNDLDEANRLYRDYMLSHDINDAPEFTSLDDVRKEVVNEIRREFYGEGQMFFTYKRTGATRMLWYDQEVGEDCYIWPLPDTEYNPVNMNR